jgi:hypothetical protein
MRGDIGKRRAAVKCFSGGLGLVPGYSALETERNGPPLWVSRDLAIEGGLLIILILAAAFACLLWWSRRSGRIVDWKATLTPDGGFKLAHLGETRASEKLCVWTRW